MRVVLILCLCVSLGYSATGKKRFWRDSQFMVGYLGEMLTHPGFQLGAEQQVFKKKKVALYLQEECSYYRHKRNHDMWSFYTHTLFQFPAHRRCKAELFGGMGYLMKVINSGNIYSRTETGLLKVDSHVIMHRFSPAVGVGFRIDVVETELFSLSSFVRPRIFWEYPYNDAFLLHGAMGMGITIQFLKRGAQ